MALEFSIFCIMLYIYNHKLRRPGIEGIGYALNFNAGKP
ncbi:hypothetical protein CKA32_004783 [Geitlerinema sp. FC II]|nr:hypothetical protein CKA32_004783 [Geitlerinema sp. FC II]